MNKLLLLMSRRNQVTNGKFDNGTTGWTAIGVTQAVVAGELQLTATVSPACYSRWQLSTIIGRTYSVRGRIRAPSANTTANAARIHIYGDTSLSALLGSQAATAEDVTQDVSFSFVATTTAPIIQLGIASGAAWGAIGDVAYFDDISVR
jgi:hypothetical protein